MQLSPTTGMQPKRVLAACEFSGRVRNAFRAAGHEAYSCDLIPNPSPYHIQDDVLNHLEGWDMIIAFPPCTYLTSGRNGHPVNWRERDKALRFVMQLADAPCDRIAIENPVGVISSSLWKPTQVIQPYWFGDPWHKRTCLWLFGDMPPLIPDNVVKAMGHWVSASGQYSQNSKSTRSTTFPGIARAMAEQWGSI
jgi:hypothetical protein